MLDSFFFSANIVLPSFILIFLGRLAVRRGLVDQPQMDRIGKLTFRFLLSTKIFNDVAACDLDALSFGGMVWFCMGATVAAFLLSWLFARRFLRRKESVGAFVQASFRCSFTVLGLTMVETFAGSEGVARATPLLAMAIFLLNILACIALNKPGQTTSRAAMAGNLLKGIVTNPLIIATALGLVAAVLNIQLPYLIQKPLDDLGGMAPALSLLCIGASLDFQRLKSSFRYALGAALFKTGGLALLCLPIAVLLGFRGFDLTVITIYLTTANPSASYVMALATDNDSDLAASAIVLSTILCVFTTMAAITILRALGLV